MDTVDDPTQLRATEIISLIEDQHGLLNVSFVAAPGDGLCLWHCLYRAGCDMPHFDFASACALYVAALEAQVEHMRIAEEYMEACAPADADEEAFHRDRVRNSRFDWRGLRNAHVAVVVVASKLDVLNDPPNVLDSPHHGDAVELNALLQQQHCEVLVWSMMPDANILLPRQLPLTDADAAVQVSRNHNVIMLLHSVNGHSGHYDLISRPHAVDKIRLTDVASLWKSVWQTQQRETVLNRAVASLRELGWNTDAMANSADVPRVCGDEREKASFYLAAVAHQDWFVGKLQRGVGAYVTAAHLFQNMTLGAFRQNWSMDCFQTRFCAKPPLQNLDALQGPDWRRTVSFGEYNGLDVLCCPEDIQCNVCPYRRIQSARAVKSRSAKTCWHKAWNASPGIPEALTNDNFIGYPPEFLFRYKVRYIEAACASPIFTTVVSFYVEADQGHLLEEQMCRARHNVAIRGNITSFEMPWQDIFAQMAEAVARPAEQYLPHPPDVLAKMVLFQLDVAAGLDVNMCLPAARLRPFVVLLLLEHLLATNHPFCTSQQTQNELMQTFKCKMQEYYPEAENDLPWDTRRGAVPAAVLEAIVRHKVNPNAEADIVQKNATPAEAPISSDQGFAGEHFTNATRPMTLAADRASGHLSQPGADDAVALGAHQRLGIRTGSKMVDQWNARYLSHAFPFTLPYAVGGPDFPMKLRDRRIDNQDQNVPASAMLLPEQHAKMLAARVEGSVRNDWNLVPAIRCIASKWKAMCSSSMRFIKRSTARNRGPEYAAELTAAASNLYKKLKSGTWNDGVRERAIGFDPSKLSMARNLSQTEQELVRDTIHRERQVAGTLQVRRALGRALFGARVEFGEPLFLTISPTMRHSGLCIGFSRYRLSDPAVPAAERLWSTASKPAVWAQTEDVKTTCTIKQNEAAEEVHLPDYTLRKKLTARDPWCVQLAFEHALRFLLPLLLGVRTCANCPYCSSCPDCFGSVATPEGGVLGVVQAYGGAVEYQRVGAPHFHCNVHVANIYQHSSLEQIRKRIEGALLDPATIVAYQEWVHRCEQFDEDAHRAAEPELEEAWTQNYAGSEHDRLCFLPRFVHRDTGPSAWTRSQRAVGASANPEEEMNVEDYVREYQADAQFVFSRVQHHVHATDEKTGEKIPLNACRAKKKPDECKHGFPATRRLNLVPNVICRGNARHHGLRLQGRRNALGTVLGRRRNEWLSGTCPVFAIVFRANSHTAPNFRVPITARTHDPNCTCDCVSMNVSVLQRIMSNAARRMTGYFSGYIQKGQPIGRKALERAAAGLNFLHGQICGLEPAKQYQRVANRVFSDLQFRGSIRPATEEFRLAAFARNDDPTAAEFVRSFASAPQAATSSENAEAQSTCKLVTRRKVSLATEDMNVLNVYGFRGRDPRVYYLSPWEFVKWWQLENVKPPDRYTGAGKELSCWTPAGRELLSKRASSKPPIPGKHYVIKEVLPCGNENVLVLPNHPCVGSLRHRCVLRKRAIPVVPVPTGMRMPQFEPHLAGKCRLLNLYLRPWVQHVHWASAHVPLVSDLDVPISAVTRKSRKRLWGKTTPEQIERGHAQSWQDYVRYHVVSQHAACTIRGFVRALDDKDDLQEGLSDEEAPKILAENVDTRWVSLDTVKHVLHTGDAEDCYTSRARTAAKAAEATWQHVPTETQEPARDTTGHIELPPISQQNISCEKEREDGRLATCKSGLRYAKLTDKTARAWLSSCTKSAKERASREHSNADASAARKSETRIPTKEQVAFLQCVVQRCVTERGEELADNVGVSEPLRIVLHGVPGAGKSACLHWLRIFFETTCEWQHGREFVFLAPHNTQAALISGQTIHSFGNVAVHRKRAASDKAPEERDVNKWYVQYLSLRWIIIDEMSSAGLEVLGSLQRHLTAATRLEGSWKARLDGSMRPFAGVNVIFAGDLWQFPPVKATSLHQNPFAKNVRGAIVQEMQAVFWTNSKDGLTHVFELTKEQRCEDRWLSYVLRGARHGCLSQEAWCCLHGYPTIHAGSWMPWNDQCECKNTACADLPHRWSQDLNSTSPRSWSERQADECAICRAERIRRCRVVKTDSMATSPLQCGKFVSAPFVHALNAAKHIASQHRARTLAQDLKRILLWVVSKDVPLVAVRPNDPTNEDLHVERTAWLRRHDQQTAGIMGLLPLMRGMPVRITQTMPDLKPLQVFKNTRGTLVGWHLQPEDQNAVRQCTEAEMVLPNLPEALFVAIPKATWKHMPHLEAGVCVLRPTHSVWSVDADNNLRVRRYGFPLCLDLAGTAHAYQGETLDACSADCGTWDDKPTHENQLSAYMCMSRVRRSEDLWLVQPFSPGLLSQGDLPGPRILLDFWRGSTSEKDLEAIWTQAETKKRSRVGNWPDELMLSCRTCTDDKRGHEEVTHRLADFRRTGSSDQEILRQGMERACPFRQVVPQPPILALPDSNVTYDVPDAALARSRVPPSVKLDAGRAQPATAPSQSANFLQT
ncbi:TTC28 [Symbiodinium microadriaticum]|nr:TTC28 [Symbiodinium microadriaticum]CAE7897064.1 TTC28 [Symbiodinium sp. KB8]